jgi:hypothetical protein
MGKDIDDYRRAVERQKLARVANGLSKFLKPDRCFGPADEHCPQCGELIETLLDTTGRNPTRCCWSCEAAVIEESEGWEHG